MQSSPEHIVPWLSSTYRDRHGRGMRQPMFHMKMPQYRTRQGTFDNLVIAQFKRLATKFPKEVAQCDCAIEDVPPSVPLAWEEQRVALSQGFPAQHGERMRIVLYRMPIEHRSRDRYACELIIRDEITKRFAQLLGKDPRDIDPQWDMD